MNTEYFAIREKNTNNFWWGPEHLRSLGPYPRIARSWETREEAEQAMAKFIEINTRLNGTYPNLKVHPTDMEVVLVTLTVVPVEKPQLTVDEKLAYLNGLGIFLLPRDARLKPGVPGKWMLTHEYDASEPIKADGSNEPWNVVGDDSEFLVDRIYEQCTEQPE